MTDAPDASSGVSDPPSTLGAALNLAPFPIESEIGTHTFFARPMHREICTKNRLSIMREAEFIHVLRTYFDASEGIALHFLLTYVAIPDMS